MVLRSAFGLMGLATTWAFAVAPRCTTCCGSRSLISLSGSLDERLLALEQRVNDLERVAPREFSLVHYNVLADQYASNLQPWFLYGADPPVSDVEREALVQKFYEKDADGNLVNMGWPNWAPDSLLSPARRAMLEDVDARTFAWGPRSPRLWEELEKAQCDVLLGHVGLARRMSAARKRRASVALERVPEDRFLPYGGSAVSNL